MFGQAFRDMRNFLGNHKVEEYREIFANLIQNFKSLGDVISNAHRAPAYVTLAQCCLAFYKHNSI